LPAKGGLGDKSTRDAVSDGVHVESLKELVIGYGI
jgi:hypothetical protein